MSETSLIDVRLLSGGYEVTADHTSGTLRRLKDAREATTFGQRDRVYRPGLKRAEFNLNGFFDADGDAAINDVHHANYIDTDPQVLTIIAPDGTEGSAAFSFDSIMSDLNDFGGGIGDMAAFTVSGSGTGDNFRGRILEDGDTSRSSSGTGADVALTGVASGETARAALHVIERTGTATVDVDIESDTVGFASPTTRLSFAQASAIGAEYVTSGTVVTDTYWRAKWTIGGAGTIKFVVNFGIS